MDSSSIFDVVAPSALALLCLVVGLAVFSRLCANAWDRARIRRYLIRERATVESIRWHPLGRGWFGDRSNRIYRVHFRDAHGAAHRATVKTSMLTGVYFTGDKVVKPAPGISANETGLKEENAALRRRVAELERQLAALQRL